MPTGARELNDLGITSYHMWGREFARDRSVLGRRIRVNGSDFTNIGVAPENFIGRKRS